MHWVGDAIQPSHSLSSPSPPAPNPSSIMVFSFFFSFFFYFYFFNFFFFLNFKIFNYYMRSQTWTPFPPPSPQHLSESTLRIKWPEYWSFSLSISPSNELSGLISFRMDWLDLFAVQGTLKSLLQHHSSKASILWRLAFFTVNSHIHTWPQEKP